MTKSLFVHILNMHETELYISYRIIYINGYFKAPTAAVIAGTVFCGLKGCWWRKCTSASTCSVFCRHVFAWALRDADHASSSSASFILSERISQ
jgi:hypothetical protein